MQTNTSRLRRETRLLVNTLPFLVHAISHSIRGRSGQPITVKMGNYSACTDYDTVYLPWGNPEDPDIAALWTGFAVHEASHIAETNPDEKGGISNALIRNLYGIIEDIRIEQQTCRKWRGAHRILSDLMRKLFGDGAYDPPRAANSPTAILANHLLFNLRAYALNQNPVREYADQAAEVAAETFPPGMMTRLNALMGKISTLKRTADSVALAAEIASILEEENDKESPAEVEQNGAPSSADNNDQSGSDGTSDTQDGDAGGTSAGPGVPAPGSGATSPNGTETQRANLASLLSPDTDWGEVKSDVGALVANLIDETAAKDPTPAMEVVAGGDCDETSINHDDTGPVLLAKARGLSNRVRARMLGLLEADALDEEWHAKQGLVLDERRLDQVALGETRLFLVDDEVSRPDTDVAILLDRSRSMQGERIEIARAAVLAATLALSSLDGVTCASFAFPGPTGVIRLTGIGEDPAKTASRYAITAGGSTPLAEAMWNVLPTLLAQPGERKILLVATDGDPNSVDAVTALIRQCQGARVEVLGLGIESDAGKGLFPTFSAISRIDELPRAMFALLQDALRVAG